MRSSPRTRASPGPRTPPSTSTCAARAGVRSSPRRRATRSPRGSTGSAGGSSGVAETSPRIRRSVDPTDPRLGPSVGSMTPAFDASSLPSTSRRQLLSMAVVGGAGLATTLAADPANADAHSFKLTVLGTTDLHGNVYNWDYFKNAE